MTQDPRDRIRSLIAKSKRSQNAFARDLGLSHGTLSRILNGHEPDLRTAVLLERAHKIRCHLWIAP